MKRWAIGVCALMVSVHAAGCSKKDESSRAGQERKAPAAKAPAAAAPAAPDPATFARTVFNSRCVVCHGTNGAGDGPGAAALNPKPRAFGDASWQSSVTDEHLKKVIVSGGAAVGKSPAMPGNPDLEGKPEVVDSLVSIIRGYKKS